MRVLIYGAGAVGLGLASCLDRCGVAADFIARPDTVSALRANGLRRTGIFGEHVVEAARVNSCASLSDLSSGVKYDYILVCAKSFGSEEAARDLAAHPEIIGGAKIILFQNGWGNKETFEAAMPGRRIYTARVITGFRRPEKNHVDITVHADAIRAGSLDPIPLAELEHELGPVCDPIDRGGIPCKVTAEVGRDLWAKILYNCALNPLGAIFGVTYGTLAEWPSTREIMNAIFDEIFAVMAAEGHVTHWPDAAAYKEAFYGKLVPTTAAHESSTLQDVRAGRRTEIDALTGAIIKLGAKAGIPVPVNATMYQMIKFLEERNLARR
ncbi:ketopantoate reductase family protein [Candidatus Sumerlaeota bacterium]|nr:ketopantoate reductase family protein [Candidatus Sumerlaeota bacterium]